MRQSLSFPKLNVMVQNWSFVVLVESSHNRVATKATLITQNWLFECDSFVRAYWFTDPCEIISCSWIMIVLYQSDQTWIVNWLIYTLIHTQHFSSTLLWPWLSLSTVQSDCFGECLKVNSSFGLAPVLQTEIFHENLCRESHWSRGKQSGETCWFTENNAPLRNLVWHFRSK